MPWWGDSWLPSPCFGLLAAPVAAAGPATSTKLHLYTPFAAAGPPHGVRVAKTAPGSCWTISLSTARSDAFRCLVGNEIDHSCFDGAARAAGTYVLCPLYTPGAPVLRIDLTKKLPPNGRSPNPERYAPWVVQTSTGRRCTLITGATSPLHGLPVSYICTGGAILLGEPRRSSPTWTILFAPSAHAPGARSVSLRTAWW